MVADFEQYYGMALPVADEDDIPDLARAALLWAALPDSSRCVRRLVPEARWTQTDYLLRAVEHGVRTLIWQRSRDGQRGRNAPRPLPTPVERARNIERRDDALSARAEIDRILGISE